MVIDFSRGSDTLTPRVERTILFFLKILHLSDLHGQLPDIPSRDDCDLIVLSGDLAPNFHPNHPAREAREQLRWWEDNVAAFREWIGEKPCLLIQGNHDYASPERLFRHEEIRAWDITCTSKQMFGLLFAGFPYIPYMGFCWNWEAAPQQMADAIDRLGEDVGGVMPYVLVAHCPPYGSLDTSSVGEHIGNAMLSNRLYSGLLRAPRAILSGHVHERGGESVSIKIGSTTVPVYNNALTQRMIEL